MTWWAWPLAVLGILTAWTTLGAAVTAYLWHPFIRNRKHQEPR